jgi:hypothetical protein
MYILIMLSYFGGYVQGASTTTLTFPTLSACQRAANEWVKQMKSMSAGGRAFCVEKN